MSKQNDALYYSKTILSFTRTKLDIEAYYLSFNDNS